jgi:hypothetical protein
MESQAVDEIVAECMTVEQISSQEKEMEISGPEKGMEILVKEKLDDYYAECLKGWLHAQYLLLLCK